MKSLYFFLLISLINGLNIHQFPNGQPIKFKIDDANPRNDLKNIEQGSAKIISKYWLENIIVDIVNNRREIDAKFKKNNLFQYNQMHIINNINKLHSDAKYMKNSKTINKTSILYLSWEPQGQHGKTEVLFLVVLKILLDKKEIIVKQIVQSPFWDTENIQSIYLKKALEDITSENQHVKINFDHLYDTEPRYKLSWNNWEL